MWHKVMRLDLLIFSTSLILLCSCNSESPKAEPTSSLSPKAIEIKSSSFQQGQALPIDLSCSGNDLSPSLSWSKPPLETHTLALIMDDPDAPGGIWQHWLVYNIPGNSLSLDEGQAGIGTLENSALQGENDFQQLGYRGPCPPKGQNHRYFFRLYALDTRLDLKAGAKREDLDQAMRGHILATGELMGTFQGQ